MEKKYDRFKKSKFNIMKKRKEKKWKEERICEEIMISNFSNIMKNSIHIK